MTDRPPLSARIAADERRSGSVLKTPRPKAVEAPQGRRRDFAIPDGGRAAFGAAMDRAAAWFERGVAAASTLVAMRACSCVGRGAAA